MPIAVIAPITALLYLAATTLQLWHIAQGQYRTGRGTLALGAVALAGHAVVALAAITHNGELMLGFYKISAAIFLVINLACAVLSLFRPLQNLLLILFPLSAMSVLVSAFAPETGQLPDDLPAGLMLHIGSSIFAYAFLTLAAAQAVLVAAQDYLLRHRHTRGIVRVLPPLQSMEAMLFELLLIGLMVLGVAIISGFLFVDDLFAQHLVHKTVLTLVAWVMFAVLLWGHHRLGWRAQTAVWLTLGGFVLLMLAFFGSKLVLELVLQRK